MVFVLHCANIVQILSSARSPTNLDAIFRAHTYVDRSRYLFYFGPQESHKQAGSALNQLPKSYSHPSCSLLPELHKVDWFVSWSAWTTNFGVQWHYGIVKI